MHTLAQIYRSLFPLCFSLIWDGYSTANQPQPAQNQPKYQILFHKKWLTAWLIYYTDFDLQCVVDLCQKGEKVNSIFSSEWCNGPKWKVSLCVFSKLSKNCQLSQLGLGCGGGEWGGKGQTIVWKFRNCSEKLSYSLLVGRNRNLQKKFII